MSACPTCRGKGAPTLFGLPMEAARAAGEAGDLALMGCLLPESAPHYRCGRGHLWRIEDEALWLADVTSVLRAHGYDESIDDEELEPR